MKGKRGVAQPGSAPVLGTGGRRFESCRPDNESPLYDTYSGLFVFGRDISQPRQPILRQLL